MMVGATCARALLHPSGSEVARQHLLPYRQFLVLTNQGLYTLVCPSVVAVRARRCSCPVSVLRSASLAEPTYPTGPEGCWAFSATCIEEGGRELWGERVVGRADDGRRGRVKCHATVHRNSENTNT